MLEGVAAVIWRLLDQPRSTEELVAAALAEEYDEADPDRVATDTAAFPDQLAEAGLATTGDGRPRARHARACLPSRLGTVGGDIRRPRRTT